MSLIFLLLRLTRSRDEAATLLGDLEEEYRARVRPSRSCVGAVAWYVGQVVLAVAHGARDNWRRPAFGRLLYPADLRFALRRWRRRPGFALTAILTLALGIGATTSIFSVVDAVILKPLPWPEADRLVIIHGVYPERRQDPAYATTWNRGTLTCPMWDALARVSAFEDVAVWRWMGAADITFGEARTEIVSTGEMSSAMLPLLRARVLHGRNLSAEDDLKPTYAMLLPYETWQRRFGGRADVVGQAVTMGHASSGGSHQRTIVGIVEPGFDFDGPTPEFLWNAGTAGEVCRTYDTGGFRGIARLAPGATLESAGVEVATVINGLDRPDPTSVRLVPLIEEELGAAVRPLWLVFAAAGILLLVACSNVAGLLLGEGRVRRHEIGVRVALGGSRFRIVRQLVVEHGLMALLGSAVGLVLAIWITQLLVGLAPPELPRLDTVNVDARAATFALSLGLATFLFFGVAPALTLARTPALRVIAEGSRDAAGGRHLGQRLIVGAEMALALVLLVGAALFGETIFRMISQPLGFNPENVAVVSTTFTGSRFPDLGAFRAARSRMGSDPHAMSRLMSSVAAARTTRVTERLRAVPGVARAAGAASLPFVLRPYGAEIAVDGRPGRHRARSAVVSEEYFDALQIPVVRGRGFDGTDRNGGATVAVVSQEFEARYLDGDAVGRRYVRTGGLEVTYQVVGVVPNVKFRQYTVS